jgi:tight adherence protein B
VSPLTLQLIAALFTGGAVALTVIWYRSRAGEPVSAQRMRRLGQEPDAQAPKRGISWSDLRRRGPASLPLMRDFILDTPWAQRLRLEIEQAGLRIHVGEYLIGRFGLAILAFAFVFGLGRSTPTFVLALGVSAGAFMLPALWLNSERNRRRNRISKQLPEAAHMIANALRAGFSFQHGLAIVADQMEPPIAAEFARANVDLSVGSTIEEALRGMLARADTAEMNLVVTAVLVQRTAGGNLAEILEMVADQIRERDLLMGEVKTMTAQQRFSGLVLALWPVLLLAVFCVVNWPQTSLLFTTNSGLLLIAIGAGLQFLGFVTIRRILDVDI